MRWTALADRPSLHQQTSYPGAPTPKIEPPSDAAGKSEVRASAPAQAVSSGLERMHEPFSEPYATRITAEVAQGSS